MPAEQLRVASLRAGRKGLISVEEWAEIRRLHKAHGMGVKAIARHLGVGRPPGPRA